MRSKLLILLSLTVAAPALGQELRKAETAKVVVTTTKAKPGAKREVAKAAPLRIDREAQEMSRRVRIAANEKLIAGTRFVDRGLKLVTTWYYVRAVNKLGVEGHYRTSYSMPVWKWYTDARRYF